MITQMAVDRTPMFRGIYCPHTLGQCPLRRWQMNCLSCVGTSWSEGLCTEGEYEDLTKADYRGLFHEKVSSSEVCPVFSPEEPDL